MGLIILIIHNVRSTHNVGSLFRTAEGLGVEKIYLTGYTPYPETPNDGRIPHLSRKLTAQIHKTALGAEQFIAWEPCSDIFKLIDSFHQTGYQLVALEQAKHSITIDRFKPAQRLALIVGNEVKGVEHELLEVCDQIVEIPMKGHKESLNVVQAAAIAIYSLQAAQLEAELLG
jgi:tRNA G18 (ribose-2'-O)-methylase SpoU